MLRSVFLHTSVFIVFFGSVFFLRNHALNRSDAIVFDDVELFIANTISLDNLIAHLKARKVVFNETELRWASKILGWRRTVRGHYQLSGAFTYDSLLSKLGRGIQDPVQVTVLPGIDIDTFVESVSARFKFDEDTLRALLDDEAFLAKNDLEKKNLLGRLYPDTYYFFWTASPETILLKILDVFDQNITEKYLSRAKDLGYSIDKIVTLASIVEWEAKNDSEKPRISGLYWNRLKKRWRLQADPTVNFALGERRRLLYEDYKFDHPYNTYKYWGLPPGPINNPSRASIEAALFPENHDFMYMVASPEGGHVFTRTLAEHNQASEEWRRWIQKQYRIKRQREREMNSR